MVYNGYMHAQLDNMTTSELARLLRADMVQRRMTLRAACVAHGLPYMPVYRRLQADGWVLRTTLVKNRSLTVR